MMRKVVLLLLLVVGWITGCQPTVQDLKKSTIGGAKAYPGQIENFTVPHVLRYESSPEVTLTITVAAQGSDGQRRNAWMRSKYRIQGLGTQRIWDLTVLDLMNDKGEMWGPNRGPFAVARMLSGPRGPIEQVDVDFPAFRGRPDAPRRDSELYLEMVRRMRSGAIVFPERPVSMGDTVMDGDQILRAILEELKLPTESGARVRSNTLAGKAVGQTNRGGRQFVVLDMSGGAELGDDRNGILYSIEGYWLVDAKSGVPGPSAVSHTFVIRNNGALRTVEIVGKFESSL